MIRIAMTDDELIGLVRAGESPQFAELVRRHRHRVYAVARRSFPADAEDITQEVFLRAFRSLPAFRRQAAFSTWLYRITLRVCVDWARARGRIGCVSVPFDTSREPPDPREDVEGWAVKREARAEVVRAVGQLRSDYRSVVRMYYFDGMSYEKIAGLLRIRPKSVETRLYRARRMLRRSLAESPGRPR